MRTPWHLRWSRRRLVECLDVGAKRFAWGPTDPLYGRDGESAESEISQSFVARHHRVKQIPHHQFSDMTQHPPACSHGGMLG